MTRSCKGPIILYPQHWSIYLLADGSLLSSRVFCFDILAADIKPSVMIVEEAAEILEGQLVAVIPPSVQHLIMIGDHKQLKPLVHFYRLKKHHLDLSMFERLVNCDFLYKQLKFQCRMRDEFAYLLRRLKIYEDLKTNEEVITDIHTHFKTISPLASKWFSKFHNNIALSQRYLLHHSKHQQ